MASHKAANDGWHSATNTLSALTMALALTREDLRPGMSEGDVLRLLGVLRTAEAAAQLLTQQIRGPASERHCGAVSEEALREALDAVDPQALDPAARRLLMTVLTCMEPVERRDEVTPGR